MTIATTTDPSMPSLWREPAPRHFDSAIPLWIKIMLVAVVALVAVLWIDKPLAVYARHHPIADIGHVSPDAKPHGDLGRELMLLEQWGQATCTVAIVIAVALLDPVGRRRALAILIACLVSVALTHLFKDLVGRSRPFIAPQGEDGHWIWGGPAIGFTRGASWTSFPSAHTSGAFALSASLAWFYPRARALFMGLATITAAQRVLHSAHYLSDVIAGMALGVFAARSTLAWGAAGRWIALCPAWAQRWYLAVRT